MKITVFPFLFLFILNSCSSKAEKELTLHDSTHNEEMRAGSLSTPKETFLPENIIIEKEFLYDKHTLEDVYPYKDTTREFQWNKIRVYLAMIDSIQSEPSLWGILKNRSNKNGVAPLARNANKNKYNNMADAFGVERYQGIPLYLPEALDAPERYGWDGSLVKIINNPTGDTSELINIGTVAFEGEWKTPKKYVTYIADTTIFTKVIFVDRTNQNIATMEKAGNKWLVRSMNPATTGVHRPPYMHETPLGIFVIQEKKSKMIFLKDGSVQTGGFAPYASRFCNGGYIHGVPVNSPRKALIEYSPTLGTTPRSHMCVRNATSHAEYVFNWAPIEQALVIVLE